MNPIHAKSPYCRVEPHMLESLDRYVEHGIPTGDFLRAVLANDLMEAVGSADQFNIRVIHEICCYVYNEMPYNCHGSYEIVKAWIERKRNQPQPAIVDGETA